MPSVKYHGRKYNSRLVKFKQAKREPLKDKFGNYRFIWPESGDRIAEYGGNGSPSYTQLRIRPTKLPKEKKNEISGKNSRSKNHGSSKK